jgi:hypothetical protein
VVAPDHPELKVVRIADWLHCVASPAVNAYAIRRRRRRRMASVADLL